MLSLYPVSRRFNNIVIIPSVSEIVYYCHYTQCLGDLIILLLYPVSRRINNIVTLPSVSTIL